MAAEDLRSTASDLVRKILSVGVGAVFLTEESLRGLISELKLPKELISGILDSAGKTRKEFLSRLSTDVLDRVLSKVDPKLLVEEILSRNEIELNVKINIRPKSKSAAAESSEPASAPGGDAENRGA